MCFSDPDLPWHSPEQQEFPVRGGRWRLRANPAYWGAAAPEVLVLGFSKGPGQNALLDRGEPLDAVPFNDGRGRMRPNLKRLLVEARLLAPDAEPAALFTAAERRFGFASLVRCSVEVLIGSAWKGTEGDILGRTLAARPAFVANCARAHLAVALPSSVRLVVMLGANSTYVREVMGLLGGVPLEHGRPVAYAYRALGRIVIHLPHPSGGNSGGVAVFCGDRAPNPNEVGMLECRRQVIPAAAAAMGGR